jgi:uncharacterized protein DUF3221
MRTFMVRTSLAILFSIGTLAACNRESTTGPKATLTNAPFFIRGEITRAGQPWGTLVEGQPGTSYRITEAYFRTSTSTLIHRTGGSTATVADLKVGTKITLWITGVIMESYPVQVEATEIIIE